MRKRKAPQDPKWSPKAVEAVSEMLQAVLFCFGQRLLTNVVHIVDCFHRGYIQQLFVGPR